MSIGKSRRSDRRRGSERGVETTPGLTRWPQWQVDERINNKCKRLTSISDFLRASFTLAGLPRTTLPEIRLLEPRRARPPLYLVGRFAYWRVNLHQTLIKTWRSLDIEQIINWYESSLFLSLFLSSRCRSSRKCNFFSRIRSRVKLWLGWQSTTSLP